MKSKFVVALLGLLGFWGCDFLRETPEMYAPGPAIFEIKGKVTEKGNPIAGIRVTAKSSDDTKISFEEITTDVEGNYSLRNRQSRGMTFVVTVEDVDGEANGGDFATQTKGESVTQKDLADGEETKIIDFELEPKTSDKQ